MLRRIWLLAGIVLLMTPGLAFSGLTKGEIKIQGDQEALRGIESLSVLTRIRGMNLYLAGSRMGGKDRDLPSADEVKQAVTQQLEAAGFDIQDDAPTTLTIEFDTPEATFMTYVNFIISEKATLVRDANEEKTIAVWGATGYQRGEVFPEPVGRLVHALVSSWAQVNGKKLVLQPPQNPATTIVRLLPDKKFSLNGREYGHDQLVEVVGALPEAEREVVQVVSDWVTRSDAAPVFKILKDAGFNARIDFQFDQGKDAQHAF